MTASAVPAKSDGMKYHRTQFDDGEQRLLYAHVEGTNLGYPGQTRKTGRQVSFWSFFHQWRRDEPQRVGPEYPSREALLASMDKYGAEFGFGHVAMGASVQEMGERQTELGTALYVRIYTPNYQQLTWDHVWHVFTDRYPGRWAIQVFPPQEELVNEQNIYHLFVLDHKPQGFNIKPGSH